MKEDFAIQTHQQNHKSKVLQSKSLLITHNLRYEMILIHQRILYWMNRYDPSKRNPLIQ